MENYSLGIDIGSISLKTVVIDNNNNIIFSRYGYTEAKPKQKLLEFLKEMEDALDSPAFSGIVFTGSGKRQFTAGLKLPGLNEIIAHAQSCWEQYPKVRSIIEIGGQDSKFIQINRTEEGVPYVEDFQFNGLCSAGTGAFLDQQSGRLGLPIEEFARMAYAAESVPLIAGRCSVFAKSDMIHLQQKGTEKGAISSGLCFALARNYLATLCKGRPPARPIVFQGGVASNRGMLRAFSEVLRIPEEEIQIPEYHKCSGAYGAALHAREHPLSTKMDLRELSSGVLEIRTEEKRRSVYPVLRPPEKPSGSFAGDRKVYADTAGAGPLYMGLDVGSVTTKGVLLNGKGEIVASASVPTRSEPVQSSETVLRSLGKEAAIKQNPVAGFYTTGSGRHLAREIFHADEGVDEITAHSRSAAFYLPEADTIFEIGGQDSKFIRLEQGSVTNFTMNRLCAAGTGSFLEEQAGRLNINIEHDFSRFAFQSSCPAALGNRCTVFMDSDLVHHIQQGEATEDLCAGLAYSIVENYLENISTSTDLGKKIILQGGVANNTAVHAAFETFLKRSVHLHPAPLYAGAVGAALLAIDDMVDKTSAFTGFSIGSDTYSVRYFNCGDCPNNCEIMEVTLSEKRTVSFGSICGKYDSREDGGGTPESFGIESPLKRYDSLIRRDYLGEIHPETHREPCRETVTIPIGLTVYEDYPFWASFFRALGFDVQNTGRSNQEIAETGKERLPVETCMPVRMLFGHALRADTMETDFIFVPHTPQAKPDKESKPNYLCPYTQTIGYIIRKNIRTKMIILGKPQIDEKREWIYRTAKVLAVPQKEVRRALVLAEKAESLFHKTCLEEGKKLFTDLRRLGLKGLVLIGRPYVAHDICLNLNLGEKIRNFGMVPVPIEFLDINNEELSPFWDKVHWEMGGKLLKAASITKRHSSLYPLLLTSFGCGPDGFIIPFLEDVLKNSPRLVLEFDENRIDTGLITRVEAFGRSISGNRPATGCSENSSPAAPRRETINRDHELWRPDRPLREYDCYIPYFSDHAYAYAGALRAAGCRAEVLPPTSERSFELARQYASGNECHPFLTILGDLLRLAEERTSSADPVAGRQTHIREAIYYSPKYIGSCLINAYETSMQLALDKMEVRNVHLLDFGNLQLMKELGLRYPYYLAMSAYTIDRLTKWAFEILPYEKEEGRVMNTHRRNISLLVERMAEHRLMKGIRETTDAMKNIHLLDKARRPSVGIAGDVFTRINPAANFGLFGKLQQNGFDTMASGLIMDVVLYRYEQLHQRLKDDGKPLLGLAAKILLPAITLLKARVDRFFPEHIRTPQESQFPKTYERTRDYIDYRVDNLISLNLNRIYELNHAGAEGILNVMCPNCMVGTMSEAFFPDLKEEQPELPITSLSFGDQQETHVDNRLEAFMHLVKEGRKNDRGRKKNE